MNRDNTWIDENELATKTKADCVVSRAGENARLKGDRFGLDRGTRFNIESTLYL